MTAAITRDRSALQRTIVERVIVNLETAHAFSGTRTEIMRAVSRRNGVWARQHNALNRYNYTISLEAAVKAMESARVCV